MMDDNPTPATTDEPLEIPPVPDPSPTPITWDYTAEETFVETDLYHGTETDDWWAQYYQEYEYSTLVCNAVSTYKATAQQLNGHDLNEQSPLILLDSGASNSVAGQKWLAWWNPNHQELRREVPVRKWT